MLVDTRKWTFFDAGFTRFILPAFSPDQPQ